MSEHNIHITDDPIGHEDRGFSMFVGQQITDQLLSTLSPEAAARHTCDVLYPYILRQFKERQEKEES